MADRLFAPYAANACCLCGSSEELSGEHKIKASLLKSEFEKSDMVISKVDDPSSGPRVAQGPRSKELHFSSRLCVPCNSMRTQPADLEFDRFHSVARKLLEDGKNPLQAFESDRYATKSEPYLNVFRYFAKLLSCQIAEVGGPRFLPLVRFAIGEVNRNCIFLIVDEDWTYRQLLQLLEQPQFAAHGGLVILGHQKSGAPVGFHSTLTAGPIRYIFSAKFNWQGRIALRVRQRNFYEWCLKKAADAEANPLTPAQRKSLGFD